MAAKVFKSTLTWRTLENQDAVLSGSVPGWPDVPTYIDEDDLAALLRPTHRRTTDDLYVASLAVLAKDEKNFKKRMSALLKIFSIIEVEDDVTWTAGGPNAIAAWKAARKKDAGSHGGKISAKKKKLETEAAIDLIRDRWPMTSEDWSTKALLKEADISLNTAKAHLGKRPIAQYNYQAKLKRAANKVKK